MGPREIRHCLLLSPGLKARSKPHLRMHKWLNFQRGMGSAGVRSQKSQKCQTTNMRNISRNAIAKRHENLLIVGWQVYERARNECASDVTRTRYAHSASIGQTVAHTRL